MVLVDPDPRFMGQVVDVEIVSTGKFYMEGKVLDECLARLPAIASSAFPSSQQAPKQSTKEKAKITVFDTYGGHCEDPILSKNNNDNKDKHDGEHKHGHACGSTCASSSTVVTSGIDDGECCGEGGTYYWSSFYMGDTARFLIDIYRQHVIARLPQHRRHHLPPPQRRPCKRRSPY
jgi:hypothetical protein